MAFRPVHDLAAWARTPPRRTPIRSTPWQPASTVAASARRAQRHLPRVGEDRSGLSRGVPRNAAPPPRKRKRRSSRPPRGNDVLGEIQHHRQSALHVGCTETRAPSPSDHGVLVAVGRDRVEVAGYHKARGRDRAMVRETTLEPIRVVSRCPTLPRAAATKLASSSSSWLTDSMSTRLAVRWSRPSSALLTWRPRARGGSRSASPCRDVRRASGGARRARTAGRTHRPDTPCAASRRRPTLHGGT